MNLHPLQQFSISFHSAVSPPIPLRITFPSSNSKWASCLCALSCQHFPFLLSSNRFQSDSSTQQNCYKPLHLLNAVKSLHVATQTGLILAWDYNNERERKLNSVFKMNLKKFKAEVHVKSSWPCLSCTGKIIPCVCEILELHLKMCATIIIMLQRGRHTLGWYCEWKCRRLVVAALEFGISTTHSFGMVVDVPPIRC